MRYAVSAFAVLLSLTAASNVRAECALAGVDVLHPHAVVIEEGVAPLRVKVATNGRCDQLALEVAINGETVDEMEVRIPEGQHGVDAELDVSVGDVVGPVEVSVRVFPPFGEVGLVRSRLHLVPASSVTHAVIRELDSSVEGDRARVMLSAVLEDGPAFEGQVVCTTACAEDEGVRFSLAERTIRIDGEATVELDVPACAAPTAVRCGLRTAEAGVALFAPPVTAPLGVEAGEIDPSVLDAIAGTFPDAFLAQHLAGAVAADGAQTDAVPDLGLPSFDLDLDPELGTAGLFVSRQPIDRPDDGVTGESGTTDSAHGALTRTLGPGWAAMVHELNGGSRLGGPGIVRSNDPRYSGFVVTSMVVYYAFNNFTVPEEEQGPREPPPDAGPTGVDEDAGAPPPGDNRDGGTSDGGTSDGGTSDGGTSDGGTSDGGTSLCAAEDPDCRDPQTGGLPAADTTPAPSFSAQFCSGSTARPMDPDQGCQVLQLEQRQVQKLICRRHCEAARCGNRCEQKTVGRIRARHYGTAGPDPMNPDHQ